MFHTRRYYKKQLKTFKNLVLNLDATLDSYEKFMSKFDVDSFDCADKMLVYVEMICSLIEIYKNHIYSAPSVIFILDKCCSDFRDSSQKALSVIIANAELSEKINQNMMEPFEVSTLTEQMVQCLKISYATIRHTITATKCVITFDVLRIKNNVDIIGEYKKSKNIKTRKKCYTIKFLAPTRVGISQSIKEQEQIKNANDKRRT